MKVRTRSVLSDAISDGITGGLAKAIKREYVQRGESDQVEFAEEEIFHYIWLNIDSMFTFEDED